MGTDYRNIGADSSASDSGSTATDSHRLFPSKRPLIIIALVFLLIAAVVAVLFGMAGGGGDDGPNSTSTDAIRAVHGPTTVNNGVPSGYTRDTQGASTAAVNTIQAIAQAGEGRVDMAAVRESMIAPEPGPTLAGALDSESNRDEDAGVLSLLPAAVTVTAFSQDAAEVTIWTIGVGQSEINDTGKVSVSTTYSTTDLSLVWQDGDWKAQDWSFRQGPRPEDASYPAADSALGGQLTAGYYTFYID